MSVGMIAAPRNRVSTHPPDNDEAAASSRPAQGVGITGQLRPEVKGRRSASSRSADRSRRARCEPDPLCARQSEENQ